MLILAFTLNYWAISTEAKVYKPFLVYEKSFPALSIF